MDEGHAIAVQGLQDETFAVEKAAAQAFVTGHIDLGAESRRQKGRTLARAGWVEQRETQQIL